MIVSQSTVYAFEKQMKISTNKSSFIHHSKFESKTNQTLQKQLKKVRRIITNILHLKKKNNR